MNSSAIVKRRRPGCPPRQQTGAVIIFAALGLSLAVILLSITTIGFLYFYKREYQKAADLAALAGAAELWDRSASRCTVAKQAASDSVQHNLSKFVHNAPDLKCGIWRAGVGFAEDASAQAGAVRVVITGAPPSFLPFLSGAVITATAVAAQQAPLAAFSVGAKLVNVSSNSPLGVVLGAVGIPLDATLLGYNGLANVNVSASGLLQALGLPLDASLDLGTINDLLAAKKVSLGFLLDTVVNLGGHSELLGLNAQLLNLLSARLGINALNLEIPLGSGPDGSGIPGLFAAIHAPDGTTASALDVGVNVLDVVTAAVGVATAGHAVAIPNLSVAIPGILPNLLQVRSGIIEPPSVAIGGLGATAYNAQVRLYADIDTAGGLIGGLLQLLGTRIHLPLFVDIGRAKGTITGISCEVPHANSTATVRVDSSVLNLCVGKASGDPFSIRTPICDSLSNETLVSVLGLIRVVNRINIDLLDVSSNYYDYLQPHTSPAMHAGDTWSTPGNPLNLGTTVSALVNELLRVIGETIGMPSQTQWTGAENQTAASSMANYYLGVGSGALTPLSTTHLGLLGPGGAYNTSDLAARLNADINRDSQGCFLGLFCWPTNGWTDWAHGVGYYTPPAWGDYVGSGACVVAAGLSGIAATQTNVNLFNQCIQQKLAQELLTGPSQSNPNFLQVLLSPLLDLLGALLDPIGNLLAGPILEGLLGIQLGVNDVKMISVGCGNVGLVE